MQGIRQQNPDEHAILLQIDNRDSGNTCNFFNLMLNLQYQSRVPDSKTWMLLNRESVCKSRFYKRDLLYESIDQLKVIILQTHLCSWANYEGRIIQSKMNYDQICSKSFCIFKLFLQYIRPLSFKSSRN